MSHTTRKMVVLMSIGLLAGGVTAIFGPWEIAVLVGWFACVAAYLGGVWPHIVHADSTSTERSSTFEDDSRLLRGIIVVGGSVVSLAGAGLALHRASQLHRGAQPVLLTAAAVATVFVSWIAMQTDFTLRYAHLYYTPPVGGIDFPGETRPDYRDFAYLAFTIGMTYQVSDTG